MSKSTYFLLEAFLNLRFVEPALSYEKVATILWLPTRARFLTLFRMSRHYVKEKEKKNPQPYLKVISK